MSKKILHISDLHVTDRDTLAAAMALIDKIIEKYDPDTWITVVTGDIVDHGKAGEFRLAAKALWALRRAGFRVYVAPGNHDYGPYGNFYSAGARERFANLAEEIQGVREYPFAVNVEGAQLLFLDSTAHNEKGEPFARGRIGRRQLAWLESHLSSPLPQWIALHHHPTWRNPFLAVSDAADLQALVDRRDNVKYLCGHRHTEDLDLIAAGKFTDGACVIEVDPVSGDVTSIRLD